MTRKEDLQQFFISASSAQDRQDFDLDKFTEDYLQRNKADPTLDKTDDNKELLLFIEKRREEQTRCIMASNYIDELNDDFQFGSDKDYQTIKRILNRRFLFLEKSIIDYSKLLNKTS